MNPFHSYTLKWWQFTLLKISLISFGLALGTSFPDVFASWIPLLWATFLVPGIYLMAVGLKQIKEKPTTKVG